MSVLSYEVKTADFNANGGSVDLYLINASSGNITVTLVDNATGTAVEFIRSDDSANTVTIDAGSGKTIQWQHKNDNGTHTLVNSDRYIVMNTQYGHMRLIQIATGANAIWCVNEEGGGDSE